MAASRQESVFLARLAESAERFDDMVENIRHVASFDQELTVEERNLMSVAYKNAVTSHRASWRIISSVEQKEKDKGRAAVIAAYRSSVEKDVIRICEDILGVLELHAIPSALSGESKVFFHKMAGDYYRYIAEISYSDKRKQMADKSFAAYQTASDIAAAELLATHPVRLGLALNFSVFYYDILDDATGACLLAKPAFDDAIAELDSLSEECYRDSTMILQLLRDNLLLWTSDLQNTGKSSGLEDSTGAE